MKVILILTLITLTTISLAEDKIKVLNFKCESFIVDNNLRKDCLINQKIIDSITYITFFTQLAYEEILFNAQIIDDALDISLTQDLSEFRDTIAKLPNYYSIQLSIPLEFGYEVSYGHIVKIEVLGRFENIPLIVNNNLLEECRDEEEFKIYKCDTINKIDRFGMKQGIWLEFGNEIKINALDSFLNHKRIVRYEFNEKGKTVVRYGEFGITIAKTFQRKTVFKYLPKIPEFKDCTEIE